MIQLMSSSDVVEVAISPNNTKNRFFWLGILQFFGMLFETLKK